MGGGRRAPGWDEAGAGAGAAPGSAPAPAAAVGDGAREANR